MPIPGCCCYGGNTPELERYCGCQDIGDRVHCLRVEQAQYVHLLCANFEYYEGSEERAYEHLSDADDAARAVT